MAYLLLLQDVADRALRSGCILHNRVDLFAENDKYLLGRFRLPRAALGAIPDGLTPYHHSCRCSPPWVFGGCAHHRHPSAVLLLGIVNGTGCTIHESHSRRTGPTQERNPLNAIGAPVGHLLPYLIHMQYHSINLYLMCDCQSHLLSVITCFPGGAHTRLYAVLRVSANKELLETPCSLEVSFNPRHTRTRSTIELTIGILKGWICLDTAGSELQSKPEEVCGIITACCALCNIAMKVAHHFPLRHHNNKS
ncbi:hypothetical protein L3Q82_021290, partial [Scortum barcoo]